MIYRFRVILNHDNKEDIFRDIEIRKTDTFEDLHNTITQSFGFDGNEMASFYVSNDSWEQGQEIALFDVGQDSQMMNETILEDIVNEDHTKLIYIYDFLNMCVFLLLLLFLLLTMIKFQINIHLYAKQNRSNNQM